MEAVRGWVWIFSGIAHFRLGQISHTICWGAKGLEEG